jgi:hypothetical protein
MTRLPASRPRCSAYRTRARPTPIPWYAGEAASMPNSARAVPQLGVPLGVTAEAEGEESERGGMT